MTNIKKIYLNMIKFIVNKDDNFCDSFQDFINIIEDEDDIELFKVIFDSGVFDEYDDLVTDVIDTNNEKLIHYVVNKDTEILWYEVRSAVQNCSFENMKYILETVKDFDIDCALQYAIELNDEKKIDYLMGKIKVQSLTESIRAAVEYKNFRLFKELFEMNSSFKIDDYKDIMDFAIRIGMSEVVPFFLQKGIEMDEDTVENLAKTNSIELVKKAISSGVKVTHKALANSLSQDSLKNREIIRLFIDKLDNFNGFMKPFNTRYRFDALSVEFKGDYRKCNYTTFALSIMYCDIDIIEMFIDKINLDEKVFDCELVIESQSGKTALSLAVLLNRYDVVKFLLSHEVDVNKKLENNSLTALDYALAKNYLDIAKLLIENGATYDKAHPYFVYRAIEYGYVEMLNFLIDDGFPIDYVNSHEEGLIVNVAISNNVDVLKLLLDKGLRLNDDEEYSSFYYIGFSRDKLKDPRKLANTTEFVNLLIKHGAVIDCDKPHNKRFVDELDDEWKVMLKDAFL